MTPVASLACLVLPLLLTPPDQEATPKPAPAKEAGLEKALTACIDEATSPKASLAARVRALRRLTALGPEVAAALEGEKKKAEPALAKAAWTAVRRLGKALSDPERQVRFGAAMALGKLGPSAAGAAEELSEALRDSDRFVRASSALALGRIGPKVAALATPRLISALKDDFLYVRLGAARAIGAFGAKAKAALPALDALLEDDELADLLRVEAARALYCVDKTRAPDALTQLRSCLASSEAAARRDAAKALGAMGKDAAEARESLEKLIETEKDDLARKAASKALELIPGLKKDGKSSE